MITQIAGCRRYSQAGREVLLTPGDSTLIDTALPWYSNCESNCVRLYLRVPRWMMEGRLQIREIPIAPRIVGRTTLGANLSGLSQTLFDEATLMESDEIAGTLDSYFEVLANCIRGHELTGPETPELRNRILHFVAAHIAEPTLTPFIIADAMGVSVRHLHRVFSNSGNTLGDYIRALRLEHCRKDLADPRLGNRSITEIAFSRGFCDAAHFSHSFRKRFGMSARVFRAQSLKQDRRPAIDGNRLLRVETIDADARMN